MDQTYNGWHNWETWNVNLWFDNDEYLYQIKSQFINSPFFDHNNPDLIKQLVLETFPNGTPDMNSKNQLNIVDWNEIHLNWIEDII